MQSEALLDKLQEYKNPIVIFCIGVLIGATFYFKTISQLYLFILCLLICSILFFVRNKKMLILIFAIIFGYFYCVFHLQIFSINLDDLLNQKNVYAGTILSQPHESSSFYKKYFFKLNQISNGSALLKIKNCKVQVLNSSYGDYEVGDIIQVTGILKKPKSAVLPGLFDEKKYLLTKNVHYLLKMDPGSLVFLDAPSESLLIKTINKLRDKLISINNKYISGNNLQLINGIILGSKASEISDDLKDKIQTLGLSHITSASGFNVSILTGGVFFLFRLFYKGNILPTIISIAFVLLYCALADFSSSILRATIFIVLVLIGNIFNKKLKILPGVSLVLLLFFFYNPVSLLDLGLQLSIFAFLGLVLFVNELQVENKIIGWLTSIFFQTLFAQIMVLPLVVFYFHNVQVLGLLSNMLAVPLASLILITGTISLLFAFIPNIEFLNKLICSILKILSDFFLNWVIYLDKISVKQIFLPNISFYFLILIYGFIVFVLVSLFVASFRRKFKYFFLVFVVSFISVYFLTDTSNYLKIFFIPKYNREAILIVPPKENPIFLGAKINKSDIRHLKNYLRLNNVKPGFVLYDLKKDENISYASPILNNRTNKVSIKYKSFSVDIFKNYSEKITSQANFVKLPILMKNDPEFKKVFLSFPKFLIINDYKRLSKKSLKEIKWLKSQSLKMFFLSKSGTIAIVTDGLKHTVVLPEN